MTLSQFEIEQNMAYGIAVLQGPASPQYFREGSQLFRLFPSKGNDEQTKAWAVVAFGSGADHGFKETTVFEVSPDGALQRWSAELLAPHERVIGRHDVDSTLANLGYLPVTPAEADVLRGPAMEAAARYARERFRGDETDAQDYAENNWGLFAAQGLVSSGARADCVRATNTINWAALAEEVAVERQARLECGEPPF